MDEDEWLRLNRENWDDRVRVHADSAFYDLPGFRAGADPLRPVEVAEVGDVAGLRLLHLQCHMGQDTLAWARRGAEVAGVDFSAEAVRVARGLAEEAGLAGRARFVVSDVYAAREALEGERFDVVYTGGGSLVWLPDLTRWAAVVADSLRPGGFLYLAEFHPVTDMLDEAGERVAYDYFDTAPGREDHPYTYTDGPELERTVSVQWRHPLGEVVSALAGAGLRIVFLRERPTTMFQRFTSLERGAAGEFAFPAGRPSVPLMYAVRAVRE
ncbi:Methyltransferase domain-containing protein [Streptomyces zhaozhouensis]|uniref:Methyltransferase domain-containing protein n=1 Tax=Streptomyces zhaozhouensis TaxID=1300267 RepID=A0A286DWT8_9ACTN|nr:class I SAM-dependent methyltransferase [Streptomyces zhaozhouensis]SOD63024.1 Methyltransferase domain-containing protein [Streptomyces zhaozhouensis]